MVGAVPGRPVPLLHRALTAADDHVVRSVATSDGLERRCPDLARSQVSDSHHSAEIVVCLAGSDS